MKKILTIIVFASLVDYSVAAGNLENTLNHCCNVGKTWSTEKKSCNITLSFPMFNVAIEHNEMCLNTVGACCLDSLREIRCNEGKLMALKNETCNEKIQQGKNQVDSMMCCEICKIGITVGSTKTICGSTPLLFGNHQWGEVYQSCCNAPKVKLMPTEIKKNYNIAGVNRCNDGTHDCAPKDKCVSTPYGFECHSRLLPLSISPENLTRPRKKPNCPAGHTYDVTEQRCKDIDECTQQPCDINEQCQNTVGSFKCLCKKGFQLDNVTNACTDINECQLNLHTCQESQRCDNMVGSYQCVRFTGCGTGYTLDVESSLCKDDDECALKTDTCGDMGPEWVCRNTLGSFRCEKKRCTGPNCGVRSGFNGLNQTAAVRCLRGYEVDRNNKCIDINECSSPTRCLKNEVCYNTNGSYYCLPKSKQFPR